MPGSSRPPSGPTSSPARCRRFAMICRRSGGKACTTSTRSFPLLHGPWGEDGTIQGLLEMADVRYVGAGVLASAVGMDKPFTKTVFSAAGLPQIPYVTVQPWQWKAQRDRVIARIKALGLPVFVKPARAGSSSGVMMVDSWDELDGADHQGAGLRPEGRRRGSSPQQARAGVRGHAAARRHAGRERRRRDHGRRRVQPRVLRLRGEVPRRHQRQHRAGRHLDDA